MKFMVFFFFFVQARKNTQKKLDKKEASWYVHMKIDQIAYRFRAEKNGFSTRMH